MTIAGEHPIALGGRVGEFFSFRDMDWENALDLAESLARAPAGQSSLSFLDIRLVIRCLVNPAVRASVSRHLLLPSGGLWSGLLLASLGMRKQATRFSSDNFIPALLTRASEKLHVAVFAEDAEVSVAVADSLRQHAPWHNVEASPARSEEDLDLLIVLGGRTHRSALPEPRTRYPRARLTIFARCLKAPSRGC